MTYTIRYHRDVLHKDIPKLSEEVKESIKLMIEQKLMTKPEIFGKPLRASLRGYRSLRVANYRVIFSLQQEHIFIFAIQHRSIVYDMLEKRI